MIGRVLVANRGEIARRVIRTCRAMTISTVAVYADPDAGEPHVLEADQAVRLPGSAPLDTYLDHEAVLGAATDSGADALHPGYGFLSENATFAQSVTEAGITWIGPPPAAIATMASKLESKSVARDAGVHVLDAVDLTGLDHQAIAEAAGALGYPVLVKASAGGGGKGMRVVAEPDQLVEAVAGAGREAEAAFGDGTLLLERYLSSPRHIGIQVFADAVGNVSHLNERDCSLQRRHQKIIEEAPSPAIDSGLREAMGAAATAVARQVGYVGAGTVEFLFHDGAFWFLEMNTRLQVEHPVTEMITGLDLVRLQIEVADGKTLAETPAINGHAIEARLYAEDPAHDFLPATGAMHRFSIPDGEGIRVDSGVEDGSVVTVHYDPMLAKVIAHATTREEAASRLAGALRRASIHGPVTNRDLLVNILEDERFQRGAIHTHFLDDRDLTQSLVGEAEARLASIAVAMADREQRRRETPVLNSIAGGWRNASSPAPTVVYSRGDLLLPVEYRNTRGGVVIDSSPAIEIVEVSSDRVTLRSGGDTFEFDIDRIGSQRFVDGPSGAITLEEIPRFQLASADEVPGSLHAPMPGRIVKLEVAIGDLVVEGQVLLVLEAMKMEHTLRSPTAGTVRMLSATPGDQVEAGAVLVVVDASTSG
jgi:propionyl-CoA carboxylase alpha chain